MMALLSIMAMARTFPDIFDGVQFPAAVDRDLTIKSICTQTAELSLVYVEPRQLKCILTIWSKKRLHIWEELEKTLHYEYNPIHNYDRTEDRKLNIGRKLTVEQDRTTNTATELDQTETGSKTGYNSGELVVSDQTKTQTDQASELKDDIDSKEDEKTKEKENLYARGNIGVTSTQDLINQQRDVVQFDIIQFIVEDFKSEFCVMIY